MHKLLLLLVVAAAIFLREGDPDPDLRFERKNRKNTIHRFSTVEPLIGPVK